MDVSPYISINPKICHGKPTFKDTRIMVHQILEMLENNKEKKEIKAAYPVLTDNHIKDALKFASKLAQGQTFIPLNQKVSHEISHR